MKIKELKELYLSHKAHCCKCGCSIEDWSGYGLGAIFVLDKQGKFYCTNCDHEFSDFDERIFEIDLYPEDEYADDDEP